MNILIQGAGAASGWRWHAGRWRRVPNVWSSPRAIRAIPLPMPSLAAMPV